MKDGGIIMKTYEDGVRAERNRVREIIDRLDKEEWSHIMRNIHSEEFPGDPMRVVTQRERFIQNGKDQCTGRLRLWQALIGA